MVGVENDKLYCVFCYKKKSNKLTFEFGGMENLLINSYMKSKHFESPGLLGRNQCDYPYKIKS